MNMATIIVKQLKKAGYLKEIDESEEINACSIVMLSLIHILCHGNFLHYKTW